MFLFFKILLLVFLFNHLLHCWKVSSCLDNKLERYIYHTCMKSMTSLSSNKHRNKNEAIDNLFNTLNNLKQQAEDTENSEDLNSRARFKFINLNQTEFYEMCENLRTSNKSLNSMTDQIDNLLPKDSVTNKDKDEINKGIEKTCEGFLKAKLGLQKPLNNFKIEQKNILSKSETNTSMIPMLSEELPKHKTTKDMKLLKDPNTFQKSLMLGKATTGIYNNSHSNNNSSQMSTNSHESIKAPVLFPTNETKDTIKLNKKHPVNQIPKETIAEDKFPEISTNNSTKPRPMYDLKFIKNNTELILKKLTSLKENINIILAKNNNYTDNVNHSLLILNVINDLKTLKHNFDQLSIGLEVNETNSEENENYFESIFGSSQNETMDNFNIINETVRVKLLATKVFLTGLMHDLAENKTYDTADLICKITNIFEEIKNMTNVELGLYFYWDNSSTSCFLYKNCSASDRHIAGNVDLSFKPNTISIIAICFATISVLSYFGLVLWRYILEKRYGTRQLLINDEADYYDSAPDIHPFEIRCEQL